MLIVPLYQEKLGCLPTVLKSNWLIHSLIKLTFSSRWFVYYAKYYRDKLDVTVWYKQNMLSAKL